MLVIEEFAIDRKKLGTEEALVSKHCSGRFPSNVKAVFCIIAKSPSLLSVM